MDRMRFETPDLVQGNIEKIEALFPNCITEMVDEERSTPEKTVYKKGVNFELLRQMLSGNVVEGDEAYEFTWVGKKAAIVEANKPIRKTLRPCLEESIDWDTTENLYIEGDNLEVLKLLQESYLGKVKMIYIDPPYNTGHDFVYPDSFIMDNDEYNEGSGYFDENGNVNYKRENSVNAGKYHSDWCSMLYSRLMLSRPLLSNDGVIFISIDDNEIKNLLSICNEVFGEHNFVGCITWFKKASPSNDAQFFSNDCEYLVVYALDKSIWRPNRLPLSEKQAAKYYSNPDNDPRGLWNSATYTCNKSKRERPNLFYPIVNPYTGEEVWPKETAVWAYSKEQCKEHLANNLLYWGVDGKAQYPRFKKFLSENRGVVTRTLWHYDDVNHTQGATLELSKLGLPYFSTPKPTRLIEKMLRIATQNDSIVLDFFSGSATSAEATIRLNAEDGGNRRFIMVQLPEPYQTDSEGFRAGFKNICEVGKERIRRAGAKIKEESPLTTQNLDTGFRVFKLDDSNMKNVYYSPAEYDQQMIMDMESNIKEDRTDLDLLFGCLLEWGLPLSMPYKSEKLEGCTIHTYNDGDLIACFDENIPDAVVKEIAKRQPLRAVFRDSSFATNPAKINVGEIFKMLAPDTRVKVI